jgi:RNA polymerase sigma-70 factor (ECF subfamily)
MYIRARPETYCTSAGALSELELLAKISCSARKVSESFCKTPPQTGYPFMADTPSELTTRPSLLVRLRGGDEDAWQTFFQTYTPLIFRYCRKRGLQEADAADVAQEVLARVARSIHTFRYQPERGRFRDWLGTVTRHDLGRYLKKQAAGIRGTGSEPSGNGLDEIPSPEADTEWTDAFYARVLQVALERIHPHFEATTWKAFERTWVDEQPAPAVARERGVGVDVVYVAKSRVLKALRAEVLMLAEDVPHFLPS